MSKVALDRVTSSFGFQAAFNTILQQIENEFSENVLYRKNPLGEPNSMSVDIDMGSHDLLNVGMVSATDFRINGETLTQSLQDTLEEVAAYPAEAKGYRDEALAYRDQAAGFSTDSSNSAVASAASAAEALVAATNATADVESELAGYVTAASGFADAAEQSALDAVAAVSDLDARLDVLEVDVPASQAAIAALETDKLDIADNIVLGFPYTAVGGETVINFSPIPSGVKRVLVAFEAVSTNGTSDKIIQLGDADGFETTSYIGSCSSLTIAGVTRAGFSTGFALRSILAADIIQGLYEFVRAGASTFIGKGLFGATYDSTFFSAGLKTLSGELDRLRVTTVTGTDTFDVGSKIYIFWEF